MVKIWNLKRNTPVFLDLTGKKWVLTEAYLQSSKSNIPIFVIMANEGISCSPETGGITRQKSEIATVLTDNIPQIRQRESS